MNIDITQMSIGQQRDLEQYFMDRGDSIYTDWKFDCGTGKTRLIMKIDGIELR